MCREIAAGIMGAQIRGVAVQGIMKRDLGGREDKSRPCIGGLRTVSCHVDTTLQVANSKCSRGLVKFVFLKHGCASSACRVIRASQISMSTRSPWL